MLMVILFQDLPMMLIHWFQSLNQSLSTLVSNVVKVIGFLVMMLMSKTSWKMTLLLALIVMHLYQMLQSLFVVKRSQNYFKQQQDSLGVVNGHIEEMYSAHVVVKAFNGEEKEHRRF